MEKKFNLSKKEKKIMEKMSVKAQAEVRAKFYGLVENAAKAEGMETEPFKDGLLVNLGDGHFVKVKVAVANPEKFDIEEVRRDYAEVLAARAERAEKARAKAEEKARKEKERAEKAAEKASE